MKNTQLTAEITSQINATLTTRAALETAYQNARLGCGLRAKDTSGWDVAKLRAQLAKITVERYYGEKLNLTGAVPVKLVTRNVTFDCELFPGGQVRHAGVLYSSPSQAMGRITLDAFGKAFNGARSYECFVFLAPSGEWEVIDTLRAGVVGYSKPVQGLARMVA